MTNHQRGFVLSNSGVIGQQGSSGNPIDNAWNGTWTTDQTYTDNSQASISPLFVKSGSVYYPTINNSSVFNWDYSFSGLNLTTGSYNCGGGGSGASMLSGTTFN